MTSAPRAEGQPSKLCIDLGSGLGGASVAFKEAGWGVVSIDLEAKFRPTIRADYSHLPLRTDLRPEIVLAGLDCRCFSVAGLRFHWDKNQPLPHTKKAIRTTRRARKEIRRLRPRYGLIENPVGKMRDERVLGKPDHTIRMADFGSRFKKPTDLWEVGEERIPFPMLTETRDWLRSPSGANVMRNLTGKHIKGTGGLGDYVRPPALRALWPPALSRYILEAVEA